MVCKDKWAQWTQDLKDITGMAPGSVDGAARCIKCDRPLLRSGKCVLGHAQDERAAALTLPGELEAMLCLGEEMVGRGISKKAVATVQAAREFRDQQVLADEDAYYQAGSQLAEQLLQELRPEGDAAQWEADPRVQAARSLIQQRQEVFSATAGPTGRSVLGQYIEGNSGKPYKPLAAMVKRWGSRVLPNGWHQQGEDGAMAYLGAYGRGIGADKCVSLARHAEYEGYPDMARGFWRRAYEIEMGHPAPADDAPAPAVPSAAPAVPSAAPAVSAPPTITGLPEDLQPGRLITMQPVDAPQDRSVYIADDAWWGQPKRDGERRVVMAGPEGVFYQARSMKTREAPSLAIGRALAQVAQERGPFVLDGEVYYLDAQGGEHRSAAQAVTANLQSGHAGEPPRVRYAIFKALYRDGEDLTTGPESERIAAGEDLGGALAALTDEIEVLPTARTKEEKAALADGQECEGREGEVWVRADSPYVGGKSTRDPTTVRTKYIAETDVVVMGLTESKDKDRPFGAIQVGIYEQGKLVEVGAIGTGFTREEMAEIAAAHAENPGQVVITVGSQGTTESGRLWHGRYRGLRTDKSPTECERNR